MMMFGKHFVAVSIIFKNRSTVQVALCVPHTFLYSVKQVVDGSNVELGAQSVYFEKKGI